MIERLDMVADMRTLSEQLAAPAAEQRMRA
jgi:hypothetical protein